MHFRQLPSSNTMILQSQYTSLPMCLTSLSLAFLTKQIDGDGNLHPLCFFSQKLLEAKINYDIHDKEMLGVIESLKEFRPWLSGMILPVSVMTHHKNLEYFMTS